MRLLLLLLTGALAGCSGSGSVGESSSAQCADVVRYDGHTYWGHSELARTPATTGRTDSGVRLGCDDGSGPSSDEKLRVEELTDLPLARPWRAASSARVASTCAAICRSRSRSESGSASPAATATAR